MTSLPCNPPGRTTPLAQSAVSKWGWMHVCIHVHMYVCVCVCVCVSSGEKVVWGSIITVHVHNVHTVVTCGLWPWCGTSRQAGSPFPGSVGSLGRRGGGGFDEQGFLLSLCGVCLCEAGSGTGDYSRLAMMCFSCSSKCPCGW